MTWANSQSESIHCQWQRDSLLISLYRRIKGKLLIFVGVFLLVSCYQVKKAVFCSEKLHLYIAQRSLQIPYHFCWCELWNPHVSPIQMDGVANISCLKNRIWIFFDRCFCWVFQTWLYHRNSHQTSPAWTNVCFNLNHLGLQNLQHISKQNPSGMIESPLHSMSRIGKETFQSPKDASKTCAACETKVLNSAPRNK